jgi:chorismate mutase
MTEVDSLISNLRAQIDEVDQVLVPLLRRRLALVFATNFIKRAAGRAVHDAEREKQLIDRAAFAGREVITVYTGIVHACRKLAEETALSNPVDGGSPPNSVERPDRR